LFEYKEKSEDLFFILHDFDQSGIPELIVVGSFADIPWYDAVYAFRDDEIFALEIGEGVGISGPVLFARESGITKVPGNEPGLITYFVGVGSLFGASVYYSKIVMDDNRLIVAVSGARFIDVATLNEMFEDVIENIAIGDGQHPDWGMRDTATHEHTHFLILNHSAADVSMSVLLSTSEDIAHILKNYAVAENDLFTMFGREELLEYFRITETNIKNIIWEIK